MKKNLRKNVNIWRREGRINRTIYSGSELIRLKTPVHNKRFWISNYKDNNCVQTGWENECYS